MGKVTALFGPSGAGKSSILRLISGLEMADKGFISNGNEVWFDKSKGIHLLPQRRSVGLVFQDYALFPPHDGRKERGIWNQRKPETKLKQKNS